ncbi:hypothetical protein RBS60_10915 [Sinomonas sp. ASV486]|uniref:hypothetical protein n=1 Tax=Sinomonas sp. ASV486 TaxID=3051170 RepID=UPI0027DDC825|nr:hypothetical protein [Sinomonas sp. ASV486]MDQ4490709.1 hypothetical protein [Sinomonas sp. ASV486]
MPSKNPKARSLAGQIAVAYSRGKGDSPAVQALQRDLRALNLEAQVARVVAQAPPLTDAQVARIVDLLVSGDPA